MSAKSKQIRNSTAEFLIFTAQGGEGGIEVRYEDETIWLSQKLMATLFDVNVPTIDEHLKNTYASREVDENSAIRKFRIVRIEGSREATIRKFRTVRIKGSREVARSVDDREVLRDAGRRGRMKGCLYLGATHKYTKHNFCI